MNRLKAEEFNRRCPECGCKDKVISHVTRPTNKEKLKEAGITGDTRTMVVGSIRCDECGYLFEYCKDGKCVIEVKRIQID